MRSLRDTTIVFVNNFPGGTLGGHEGRLLHVMRACREAGMHVHLICQPGSALEAQGRELDVRVASYPLDRRNLVRTRSRIRKYLKRYDADIVQGTGFLTNVLVRLAGGPMRATVVSTGSCEPDAPRRSGESRIISAMRDLFERATAGRSDVTIAVSQAVADALEVQGVPRQRIEVIRTAVSVVTLRRLAEGVPGLPPDPEERMRVGMVGRLQRVKGGEVFVAMAETLGARRDDVVFYVAGDGEEGEYLRGRAREGTLGDRLVFLGHVVPAAPVIASMDVLVVPSLSEGLGTVALEAGALGIPVVASRVGGLVESVVDGETGTLVPADDPAALADGIEALLDDPDLRARMGRAGQRYVAEDFSVLEMIEAHLKLYRRIVSAR